VPKINSVNNFKEEVPYTRKGAVKISIKEEDRNFFEDC
jgi:hypothetical protein